MGIVFVTIVALNALIAYSGDIFDRILEERTAVLIRIKAECILELYCLMPQRMREGIEERYKWTYRLIPPGGSCSDELNLIGGGEDHGSGGDKRKEDDPLYRRANKMDVKELEKELKDEMNEMDKKLDKMKNEMKSEMKEIEKKTDERFNNMEKKIDRLLELLE